MKKNLTTAVIPALSLALVLSAVAFSFAANSSRTAAAPARNTQSSAYSPQNVPLAWSGLLHVSNNGDYDNTSSIASSPLDAAITIGWEERDEANHTYGAIMQASNTSVGAPLNNQRVSASGWKEIGNVVVRADSQGRRHMAYYEYSGSNTCGKYAQVNTAGNIATDEVIPGSCGGFYKQVAAAIGPGDVFHVILGRDNQNLYYFQRAANGAWTVQNERVYEEVNVNNPTNPTLAVSTGGVIMAAWLQGPNGGGRNDVITGRRTGPGTWVYENISASCCTGCSFDSLTYDPSLTADNVGGIRAAWIDEQCNPRLDPRRTDTYYREWVPGTGWDNRPLVLVDGSGGQQFWADVAVDNTGKAHIGYSSDSDRGEHNYTFAAVSGQGTTFTSPERPFFNIGTFIKEGTIAHGPGYIFASFNSGYNAPGGKTIYYTYKDIPDTGGEPTPTPTPLPTATPLPPRCPGETFTDVCPGDFFYAPVLELNRQGVMSGYNSAPPCDGSSHIPCFKPFNNITRGQAAKVIALGANLPANLAGAPHFQDVDPNHTFYIYIEFAYNAGVISGYNCGGPGEPCVPPGNKPYFRSGNNLTRGQLSKMAAVAFNLTEPVSGQTFEDVPPSSTFYEWIQRLSNRGILNGYPCGGAGEPCVPPQNRPYFRPNNDITRGQTAKVVSELIVLTAPTSTTTPLATATSTTTATSTITATSTATAIVTATTTLIPTITVTVTITGTVQTDQ